MSSESDAAAIGRLHRQLGALEGENAALLRAVDNWIGHTSGARIERDIYKGQRDAGRLELGRALTQRDHARKERDDFRDAYAAAIKTRGDFQTAAIANGEECHRLRGEIARLRDDLAGTIAERDVLAAVVVTRNGELSGLQADINAWRLWDSQRVKEINTLRAAPDEARERLERVRAALA